MPLPKNKRAAKPHSLRKSALLLSIFSFPGAGHLKLKRYKSAIFFISSFVSGSYVIFDNIMSKVQVIADQIVRQEISLDLSTIMQAINDQPNSYSSHMLTVAYLGLFILLQLCVFDVFHQTKADKI